MAIADMFLKMPGLTGEAQDADHKGEVDVVSWSWGMHGPALGSAGQALGRSSATDIEIVKRVDQSTPTLMKFLRQNKVVDSASLIVRKAGKTPLEYFRIDLTNVRVTSLVTKTEGDELVERVNLGFDKVVVTYTPQDATGAKGGGANVFEADMRASS